MDSATQAQIQATIPQRNVWVSANAGSGKTRVLINRVVRLMLNGTSPDRILCLTYTKAAAAEMLQRLFERLGEWAMYSDAALTKALIELGEDQETLSADRLDFARKLFAQALDIPGGLKVQTIHSFCESVLRRFPIEAGISPNFTVLDEREETLLLSDRLEQFSIAKPDLFREFSRHFVNADLNDIVALLQSQSDALAIAPTAKDFGVDESQNHKTLQKDILAKLESTLAAFIDSLRLGGSTDQKLAQALNHATNSNDTASIFVELENKFLLNI